MKKKGSLFKILGIVILAYAILSWIIPAASSLGGDLKAAERMQTDLFGLIKVPFESFGVFASVILFVVLVGVFYAILEETGVYEKALEKLAKKFNGREKIVLIAIISIVAVISSITGLEVGMFITFPFIISLLMLMGYDKLTALAATVGATVIGIYGSTISGVMYNVSNQVTSSVAYGIGSTTYKASLFSGIVVKILLLLLGLAALIFFTLRHANKVKAVVKEEKKEEKTKKEEKKSSKKANSKKEEVVVKEEKPKKLWPLYTVLCVMLVIIILGTIDFEALGVSIFTKFDEWFKGVKIFGFPLFGKLFGDIPALGTWGSFDNLSSGVRFTGYSFIMIIGSLILAAIYRIGPSRYFDAMTRGIKDYIIPGILTALAYSVFIFTVYYPVFNTIGTWLVSLTKSFNVALSGLFSMISSVLYSNPFYAAGYGVTYLAQAAADVKVFNLITIMYTNLYGLMMLIAPTSVLLLTTLAITEVSYKDWIKYIWKLFLALFVVSFVVLIIVFLV